MASSVGSVGNTQSYYNQYVNNTAQSKEQAADTVSDPVDTYTPSKSKAADQATINKLWKEMDSKTEAVRKLVQSMLGKTDAAGQGFWAGKLNNGKLSESDRAEAQKLVDEDGYFGVKQTSERIMSFAKALVGENASDEDIEKMRSAVQKGFDDVAKLFGGYDKLPDVSKQTYDSIMKSFDEWKSSDTAE